MNCQILYMEHFAMLCCTNHSAIMAVQRFRESFLVENSIHAFKKPEKVFAKTHCTHCLNAVPEHGSKIGQKHREIIMLSYLENSSSQRNQNVVDTLFVNWRRRGQSILSRSLATELRHQFGTIA